MKTIKMCLVVQFENNKNKCVTLTKNALCNQYVSFFFQCNIIFVNVSSKKEYNFL